MSRESYVKKSDLQDILDGIAEKIPKAQVTLQAEKTTLWSGEQTATGTLTLSDSVDNYDEIEIYMLRNGECLASNSNYVTSGGFSVTVQWISGIEGNMTNRVCKVEFTSGTTATVSVATELSSSAGVLGKIVGVKYSEETIFPDATSTVKGKTKLYNDKGNNTDGAITQKAVSDNYVDKSGDIMTGNLTVNNIQPRYLGTLSDTEKGTYPSANRFVHLAFGDKDGTLASHRYGAVETAVLSNGAVVSSLMAYKNEANATDNASIQVTYFADGTVVTGCPDENGNIGGIFTNNGGTLLGDLKFRYNSPHIFLKTTGVVKGTIPDTDKYSYLTFNEDSDALDGRLGMIQNKVNGTTGSVETQMLAFTPTAGSTDAGAILVRANADGTFATSCPNADSTGSNKIMTKAGGTFTGNVAYKYSSPLVYHSDNSTKGTSPSSSKFGGMIFQDSVADGTEQHRYGGAYFVVDSDGSVTGMLQAYKNTASATASSRISITVDNAGNTSTYAPNPSTNSNTNEIATTKWVRDTIAPVTEGNATRNTTNTTAGTCFWQKNGKVVTVSINDVVVKGTGTAITIFTTLPTVAGSKQYHFPMIDRDGNSYLAFVSGTGINIRVNTATAQGLFGSVSYMTT